MENEHSGNFICRFCKGSFTQAQHLYKHVQLIHAANPSTKNSRTCPICGTVFAKYEGYRTHLRHIHGQRNEGQIFAFKCFNDFFLWKTELENRSACKYSLHTAPKLLPTNEKIHVYQCDATKKKKGSCSALDSCAAMICATESMKNHEIKVEYWNTHLGHSVPVEDDELNAAINSVQSAEEPTMHVMDMLNSIDQSIETGAEVFVTETIEEEHSLSPVPKKNQRNIFNIKKTKPSAITATKNPPIVQNFSFKKDPSKKKESSIYSLASVACGKISANKAIKSTEKNISKIFQNSMKKNVQTNIISNSVKSIDNSISELTDEDTLNHLDHIPKSSLQDTSVDEQFVSLNSSPSITNKKQIVYNWPVGKPFPTDWVFSDPPSSEEKSSKNLKEKENISSISNKIIVPFGLEINKSKEEKSAKPKISKVDVSVTKSKSKQTSSISTSVAMTTSATQFAKSPIPLSTTPSSVSPQIANSIKSLAPTQLVPSVLPAAQTYLSVNDKLIPYNPLILPPNLNSNVLVPVLSNPPSRSLLQTSASKSNSSTSKGIGTSYQPPVIGVVKQNTIAPPTGTVPSLSNSFAGSHLILLPCTNNSSLLQPGSSSAIASPLVLQNMIPSTSAPGSQMFVTSLLKPVTASQSQQTTSLVSTAISPLSGNSPASSSVPTNLSNAVKVQKVSLPTAGSSVNVPEKRNTNSVLALSQPSHVSSVVLNTAPISSTPTISIPGTNKSNVQKPGTYVFESSGELYMLEPLDDDIVVIKDSSMPLTSTPKKVLDFAKIESSKRKYSSKKAKNEKAALKSDKLKKSESGQSTSSKTSNDISKNSCSFDVAKITSNTIGAVKKKKFFPESNHKSSEEEELGSPLNKFGMSALKNLNGATIDSDLTKSVRNDGISSQKTEMTIKITPSQHLGKKEVSIFTNTSPLDLKTKLPINPLKYTPSLLTVKTVPSFSLHQSRPVTSTLNSLKTLTSGSLVTSSTYNYVSSASQSTPSVSSRSTPLLSCEKEAKTSSTIEGSLHQGTCPSTQNVEVKRNVTIKSVVQEKRSATDDDLEVMKKVKFYKLEMKYLACQEQCKKLKIELAKALSKNKELLQDIEEKENNEMEQNSSNTRSELVSEIENTHAVESQKLTLNENRGSLGIRQEKLMNDEIQEENEVNFDVKSTSSLENVDSNRSDSENEMDVEFDIASCEQINKPIESDQVSKDQERTYNGKEECSKEHLDCDPLEMEVDDHNKESTGFEEAKNDTDTKTNSNVDIFTMVRTSVLKNLYMNIEDLTEEKKQLQKDLEEYKKLGLKTVPSFEEYEDSL